MKVKVFDHFWLGALMMVLIQNSFISVHLDCHKVKFKRGMEWYDALYDQSDDKTEMLKQWLSTNAISTSLEWAENTIQNTNIEWSCFLWEYVTKMTGNNHTNKI